jgi:hypothetical protein
MAGTLSDGGEQVLRVLYGAATWHRLAAREECVTITLAQVRARMPYGGTDDALSKLIRRLRDAGWFEYRIERKRRDHWYTFRLLPDEPLTLSDLGPSESAQPERDSGHLGGDPCPSEAVSCPSENGDESPAHGGIPSERESVPVRAAQRNQRTTTTALRRTEFSRARGRDAKDEAELDRLWKDSAPAHPGAYSEPGS